MTASPQLSLRIGNIIEARGSSLLESSCCCYAKRTLILTSASRNYIFKIHRVIDTRELHKTAVLRPDVGLLKDHEKTTNY